MNKEKQKIDYLLKANLVLSSTLDTKELLTQIINLAKDVVGAQAASILLYDKKDNVLLFDVALGGNEKDLKTIKLKLGEGVAGSCAGGRKPIIINDVNKDNRWSKAADDKTSFKTKSLIAVPMLFKNELIGVLEALNKHEGDFDAEDTEFLQAFAAQSAVAIENARAFAELYEEKEKINAIFSQMSDCTVLLDNWGDIVFMNPAAINLFGEENVKKKDFKEVISAFSMIPELDKIYSSPDAAIHFELNRHQSKGFYLSGIASKICNNRKEPAGLLLVFRDVTSDKKETIVKRNFVSLMSHKLRTPLVSILGYAALLSDDTAVSEMQKKAAKSIHRQGSHLSRLVDKLINFSIMESRTHELSLTRHTFMELIEKSTNNLKDYFVEKETELVIDEKLLQLPPMDMDFDKLELAIRNILENAAKFNTNNSRKVKIAYESFSEWEGLSIEDNGPGIPPEERGKIFQKFYQIEESFTGQIEGAGLGLALAKRIVEAHGGTISLVSRLGEGSKFTIAFPKNRI